jgi:predicted ester cyclase
MSLEMNKRVILEFLSTVWEGENLDALPDFWSEDCVNHEMPAQENRGLILLRAYHASFFAGFSDLKVEIVQQVAEGDRVATTMISRATHSGDFFGIAATGKRLSLMSTRIDRLRNGKISEHWSVGDIAGLMKQLQA